MQDSWLDILRVKKSENSVAGVILFSKIASVILF